MKKIRNILLIIILAIFILNTLAINNKVYATRGEVNDLSNLSKYPSVYTLVRELQVAHPKWNFVPLYTGLDWNSVIYNETTARHSRSLVQKWVMSGDINDWLCPTCGTSPYDNGSWYCASPKTASYYIDVRNWLNEKYIFAFESLQYNQNLHTIEGVKEILKGTFMEKDTITYIDTNEKTQVINKSYAQVFMEAGKKYNISPYILASRVKQEQGDGTSPLITGKYTYTNGETQEVFIGYYNYFNVKASGNGNAEIIKKGLGHARDAGWLNPELSILGGAEFLANNYINLCQDTLYLQKYALDPAGNNLYGHQYMQNVSAPFTEGNSIRKGYLSSGKLDAGYKFVIPVFENMPAMASVKPGNTTSMKLVSENVVVTTTWSPLTIREGAGGSYPALGTVPKGATLTRIEKAQTADVKGIYWDKISYNNGQIVGYATREYLKDVPTTETVNEPMITTEMCNLRNLPETTNSSVMQILQQETQVTVINKGTSAVDGHIWYRVKLENGTQGYVSSAFLKQGTVEKYKIDGTYAKIAPGTAITDIPGAVLNGKTLGTGATVTIDGVNYTLVVSGDCDGDGKVNSMDMYKIIQHILENTLLQDAYFCAVDLNSDSKIDSMDMYNAIQIILKN